VKLKIVGKSDRSLVLEVHYPSSCFCD